MSEIAPAAPAVAAVPAASAGAQLRAAREAAGLSIESVAQQLKLAPRQVAALEQDRFELLPGRTFIRGFLRNYARVVGLDPERVLAGLPDAGANVPLAPTRPAMGEIKPDGVRQRNWSRWAIPAGLLGLVIAVGLYEYARPGGDARGRAESAQTGVRPSSPNQPAPATPATAPAAPVGRSAVGTPLPNPLETGGGDVGPSAREPDAASAGPSTASSGSNVSAPQVPAPAGVAPATAAPGEATLVIVYRGSSWTEVKDGAGRTVLSLTGTAGTTQSVSAAPPLDVVIGNASDVSVTFRGAAVDLTPYLRQNVAKLKLP